MPGRKSKSAPVGVISKVLRIFEVLDRTPAGLQLKDVATQTGLNKSTAHRFLTHLETEGYLFRDSNGAYTLGPKIVRLGSSANFESTLCRLSRPTLENLWKITGETVNLAVLDKSEIVYLDVLESLHTFRLVSTPGMRRPVYCTALGKSILSNIADPQQKDDILAGIHFEAVTSRTITSVVALKRQLARIQKQGFAIDDEEAVTGARCIGAALFDGDGKVVGGISVSGPVVRITRNHLPLFIEEIRKAATEISARLGYRLAHVLEATSSRITRPKRL